MDTGENFSAVKSIRYVDSSHSINFVADFVSGKEGKRFKAKNQGGVWKLPYDAIKDTYADGGTTVDVTYDVRKRFENVPVTSNKITVNAASGESFVSATTDTFVAHRASGSDTQVKSGGEVSFDTNSSGTLEIDADGMSLTGGNAHVIATVRKTAAQKTKTLQTNQTHPNINVTDGNAASYTLNKADVYKTFGDNKKIKKLMKNKFQYTHYKKGVKNTCKWFLDNKNIFNY